MSGLLSEIKKLSARSWLLVVFVCTYLLWSLLAKVSVLAAEFIVLPCSVALVAWECAHGKIRRNLYNALLFAMAAVYTLASVRNGLGTEAARYALIVPCAAMLVAGVVPADADGPSLRREAIAMSVPLLALMLPLALLGVISVFAGRPMHFLWKADAIGIPSVNHFKDRIRLLAHPNTSGTLCLSGILMAAYWLCNRPRRWLRVLLGFSIVVFAFAITHCQSRSGNIALALVAGAFVFRAICIRGVGGRWRFLVGLAAWALVFGATLWLINGLYVTDIRLARLINAKKARPVVSRTVRAGTFEVFSNGRDGVWKNGIRYLLTHPADMLLGMGSGDIMVRIRAAVPDMLKTAGHLHNAFLETLARGGVLMLASAVGMLALLVKPCVVCLTAPETEENRGRHVFAIIIGAMLSLSLVEVGLFCYPHLCNILFFYAAGRVTHDCAPAR